MCLALPLRPLGHSVGTASLHFHLPRTAEGAQPLPSWVSHGRRSDRNTGNDTKHDSMVVGGVGRLLQEQGCETQINYARVWMRLDVQCQMILHHFTMVSEAPLNCS